MSCANVVLNSELCCQFANINPFSCQQPGLFGNSHGTLLPKNSIRFYPIPVLEVSIDDKRCAVRTLFFSFMEIAFKLPSYYVHIYYIHTILCLQLFIKYCLILALSLCIPSFYPFILPFKFPESIYNYLSHCPFLVWFISFPFCHLFYSYPLWFYRLSLVTFKLHSNIHI